MNKIYLLFILVLSTTVFFSCKTDEEPTLEEINKNKNNNNNNNNTTDTVIIVINEVVSNPPSGFPDWIELYNAGTTTANLGGYKLIDSKGLIDDEVYIIPENTMLEAGKFIVFKNGTSFTFGLSGSNGDEVILATPSDSIIDHLTFSSMATANSSYGRKPDGSTHLYYFNENTEATSNNLSTVIN